MIFGRKRKNINFISYCNNKKVLSKMVLSSVFYGYKSHDWETLMKAGKEYATKYSVCSRATGPRWNACSTCCNAPTLSSYNPDFEITKADIEAQTPKVERLRDIVEKVCREQIVFSGCQIKKIETALTIPSRWKNSLLSRAKSTKSTRSTSPKAESPVCWQEWLGEGHCE